MCERMPCIWKTNYLWWGDNNFPINQGNYTNMLFNKPPNGPSVGIYNWYHIELVLEMHIMWLVQILTFPKIKHQNYLAYQYLTHYMLSVIVLGR